MLCVNQLAANQGLDARCRGLGRALRKSGGRTRVIRIDDQSTAAPAAIAAAIDQLRRRRGARPQRRLGHGVGRGGAAPAPRGRTTVGTFDLGPDVLRAVRHGKIAFAIDQQAYLQGYLPVILLAQRARFGLFPARRGELIPTGPNFVTRRDAGRVIDLARRSIR